MNYYPAKKIKVWCDENLSPLAWQRIVLRSVPDLDQSVQYEQLEEPYDDMIIDENTMIALNKAAESLYQTSLPVAHHYGYTNNRQN